jgi:SpoVK/Ycf46/Vps4 family AAA+-type ATPase
MKEGLTNLAARIDPTGRLADLALTGQTRRELTQILDSIRSLQDGQRAGEASAATVLLHGPSGAGKTMAALALASELGLPVMRIDLAAVVSKYIAETEKQLDAVFRDAQQASAILFFDEADALFGERTEVKDSHDRYANIEISYLLQRLEDYSGLVILATNTRPDGDAACLRRVRFIVEFPRRTPDAAVATGTPIG